VIEMIVDASDLVVGRLSSKVAKLLVTGENIIIVNAEKAVIVGGKEAILAKYKMKFDARVLSNPHFGPKYSRIPSRMLRRIVKGMLPNKSRAAERMIKKLQVFNGVPKELKEQKMETIAGVKCNEKHDFMSLKELGTLLGGRW
jgi:large subunit ribosomal protein L13